MNLLKSLPLMAVLGCAANISFPQHEENESTRYAVLISGQTEERHVESMTFMYNTISDYGFKKEDICILDEYGFDRETYDVNGAATRTNVLGAFHALEDRIDSNDILLVYVTDHGNNKFEDNGEGFATIAMIDHSVLDQHTFAMLVARLDYRKGFFLFDQCYGGAFAQELGYGNNVAFAASEADSLAYSTSDGRSFSLYLVAGFGLIAADANRDGRVSAEEAFNYAYYHFPMLGHAFPVMYTEQNASTIFMDD